MSSILAKGVIRNGRVEIDRPIDLPDGTAVVVASDAAIADDEDWDNSPEGIAEWLKWYDSLQPLIFTDEERSALEADRQSRKEWEKAHFADHADALAREWQ